VPATWSIPCHDRRVKNMHAYVCYYV
jgi:hypothetical protein